MTFSTGDFVFVGKAADPIVVWDGVVKGKFWEKVVVQDKGK